jgi:hypothetical protein
MAKPWWQREETTLEEVKPDVLPTMGLPPLRPMQIMEALYRYRKAGVPVIAIAREADVHQATIHNFLQLKATPKPVVIARLSWLIRALDANHVKFIQSHTRPRGGRRIWVLVKGGTPDDALVAKPTLGICACGRYQSCPCGLATDASRRLAQRKNGPKDADSQLALQQSQVRARVGHDKPGSPVPKVPQQARQLGAAAHRHQFNRRPD